MAKQTKKLIANNKKAYHDYFIEDKYEAGISLAGTEVKSLRMGRCSVKEAFIRIEKGEVYVYNMHIPAYENFRISSFAEQRFIVYGACATIFPNSCSFAKARNFSISFSSIAFAFPPRGFLVKNAKVLPPSFTAALPIAAKPFDADK